MCPIKSNLANKITLYFLIMPDCLFNAANVAEQTPVLSNNEQPDTDLNFFTCQPRKYVLATRFHAF